MAIAPLFTLPLGTTELDISSLQVGIAIEVIA